MPFNETQLMLTLVLVWAIMGVSWNVFSGYSGLVAFGHASFFGLGAYTVALLLVKLEVTPWIGIPIGMLVGVAAGVYLEEYAPKNWMTDVIEVNVTNLAGVP